MTHTHNMHAFTHTAIVSDFIRRVRIFLGKMAAMEILPQNTEHRGIYHYITMMSELLRATRYITMMLSLEHYIMMMSCLCQVED